MGSFRQLLLVAFMLIAALLGAAALRAVVTLDRLMAQSSEESARALELSGASHALAARTAAMERAARQSLVLNDSLLRRRFEEETQAARSTLQQLAEGGVAQQDAVQWGARLDAIVASLDGPPATALDRERDVAAAFRELDEITSRLTGSVQATIHQRNGALQARLEAARVRLMQQVVAAIVLALVLAVAMGLWLARPFRRLQRAILALGENRLDQPIHIRGPSDVRRVGQQLDWLRLRLMELDADKARFLRHVSHELKTPLAALREGIALLRDGVAGKLGSDQQEVVGILHQNAFALQAQIEALLRFNAAAFEARQLQRRPVDLLALVREQVQAQRLQWQARRLSVEVAGTPATLSVDPDKLGAAVANLLSNAIRYSPEGAKIILDVSSAAEGVRIDVRDEGPGVADQDRDRVFEPFYRGARQPRDAVRGSGVGLSIVNEYVAAHGGRVRLLPDSDGGHFRIELPYAA